MAPWFIDMDNMQIRDNFLDENEFDVIRTIMLPINSADRRNKLLKLSKLVPISDILLDPFPWYGVEGIITKGIVDGKLRNDDHCYNMHMFYVGHRVQSNFYSLLDPILNKIQLKALIRIKANSFSKTEKIIEHGYHRDYGEVKDKWVKEQKTLPYHQFLWVNNPVLKESLTSIFYVNTNDGYTKFKDGTIIESVGNRLLTFPTLTEHTSSTCTDKPTRVNINFNYF